MPDGLPELTLGWEAVKWASKYLRQPNGPTAGQRFVFVDSQIRFLLWWYALDGQGRWLFRRAVRRLAKGSGKSPFAALMALVELCAPVRLAWFDPDAPGGCVGKAVAMPLVQIAATTEQQTENTMRMVRAFAPKGSRVCVEFGLNPGLTIYYKAGGGKLHTLTSSPRSAEGGEATFIVGDEPEHWLPNNNGQKFASTLADNLAKSGSRMLETCNSWEPGAGSVAEASFASWVDQEEGRTRGRSKILYDARVADPRTVLTDEPDTAQGQVGLSDALEFVYGDCWWADLDAIKERVWDLQSAEDDSRRKYLNQPTAANDAWVTQQEWQSLLDERVLGESRTVADNEDIVLFFDGSKSRDATAIVGCCMSDGHIFTVYVYEPSNAHDTDDVVPAGEVDAAVINAFEQWNVVAFFADVQEWQGFVKVTWAERYRDSLTVWAVPTGKDPQPIGWDMRSHAWDFAVAAETAHAEILEAKFTHDGDSRLERHVINARRHPYRNMVSVSKETPDSPRKIDAAVCMIGARMARRLVLASPNWHKNESKSGRVHGFA